MNWKFWNRGFDYKAEYVKLRSELSSKESQLKYTAKELDTALKLHESLLEKNQRLQAEIDYLNSPDGHPISIRERKLEKMVSDMSFNQIPPVVVSPDESLLVLTKRIEGLLRENFKLKNQLFLSKPLENVNASNVLCQGTDRLNQTVTPSEKRIQKKKAPKKKKR